MRTSTVTVLPIEIDDNGVKWQVRTWTDGEQGFTVEVRATQLGGYAVEARVTKLNGGGYSARVRTKIDGDDRGWNGVGSSVEHVSEHGLRSWGRYIGVDVGGICTDVFIRAASEAEAGFPR